MSEPPARPDPDGMLAHAEALGAELVRSWQRSRSVTLPWGQGDFAGLIIAGVGGSASAADAFASLVADESTIPVQVVRGWRLPGWAGPRTLVAVSSYSGSTEEALAMYADAKARGCAIVAVTAGGQLGALAASQGRPIFNIDYSSQPRAAFAHGLGPLLALGAQTGISSIDDTVVAEAAAAHERAVRELSPGGAFPAASLAAELTGRHPWVAGGGHLTTAAVRFKNQLAENAKVIAAAESLPEAGHNLVVGLDGPAPERADVTLVTFESGSFAPTPLAGRFEAFTSLFAEAGVSVRRHLITEASRLAELLVAVAIGDIVSVRLAMLRGIDPTPIRAIDELKRRSEAHARDGR
ncbi:MAG: SIS domain-containing protein [Dehalococcoidia bacterium]